MEKCTSCIWLLKVNEFVSVCPYSRCIKENGWLADKKNKNSKNK